MTLSPQQLDRIHQEELARLQIRRELKRQRRPRLILIATAFATVLVALAQFSH